MALGSITVLDKHQISGTLNHDEITFNGDGAYPAGGTPGFQDLVRKALGKGNVTIINVDTQDSAGFTAAYDALNDKLKIFTGAGAEASGNLGSTVFRIVVISK